MTDFGYVIFGTFVKLIFVMLLIGWIPAAIAHSKGRKFFPWWIYGGALFIIALIHSICMCNKDEYLKRKAEEDERLEKMIKEKNEAYEKIDPKIRRML